MAHMPAVLVDLVARFNRVRVDGDVLGGHGLQPYDACTAGLAARDATLVLLGGVDVEGHRGPGVNTTRARPLCPWMASS